VRNTIVGTSPTRPVALDIVEAGLSRLWTEAVVALGCQ
jgi:hypothetical protein